MRVDNEARRQAAFECAKYTKLERELRNTKDTYEKTKLDKQLVIQEHLLATLFVTINDVYSDDTLE